MRLFRLFFRGNAFEANRDSITLPGERAMRRFRYRTATLLGPWRETADAAVQDAIRAKQARRDEDGPGWHWVVPGAIEQGEDGARAGPGRPDLEVSENGREDG